MKNKHSVLLIIFTFLLNSPNEVFAQKHFLPGYIVTNYGDTVFGKVKDRKTGAFVKLYDKIRFKPNKGFRKRLSPNDIQAYQIGYVKFITMDIRDEIVLFKRLVREVPNSNNKQYIKIVSEGYLSWYEKEYVDDSGLSSAYYFKRADEFEMVFVRSGLFGLNKKRLAEYFDDCPELVEKIINRSIKSPEKVFRFYNDWCGRQ